MKPLTLEETKLKEEMKNNCLKKGQYIDDKAKDKFKMLCHLEDFEIEYWNLQQENQQLKIQISARKEQNRMLNETNKVLSQELTKGNLIKQDHLTTCCGIPIGDIPKFIDKYNKLEDNWYKLKKFLELRLHENCNLSMYGVVQIRQEIEKAIFKMQELERSVSDEI